MIRRMFLVAVALIVFGNIAQAQRGRRYVAQPQRQQVPQGHYVPQGNSRIVPQNQLDTVGQAESTDALIEVNMKRAKHGLPPFKRDEGLTQAAYACAKYRANRLMFDHTSNDFSFLAEGVKCASTGCAAYEDEYGWMSCCVDENFKYGGAAWVRGRDGKRYMSLFVR